MITSTFYKFAAETQANEKYPEITPAGVAASTAVGGAVGAGFGGLSTTFSPELIQEAKNYRNLAQRHYDASAKNLHNLLDINSKLKADASLKNNPEFQKRVNAEIALKDSLDRQSASLKNMHKALGDKSWKVFKRRALKGLGIGAAFGGLGTLAEKMYYDRKNNHS